MATYSKQTKNNTNYELDGKSDMFPAGRFGVGTFDESQFDKTEAVKSIEYIKYIRRGKRQTMGDLAGYKFNDKILSNNSNSSNRNIWILIIPKPCSTWS